MYQVGTNKGKFAALEKVGGE